MSIEGRITERNAPLGLAIGGKPVALNPPGRPPLSTQQGQAVDYEPTDDLDELPAPPRKEIPSADRELLELAARALGAEFEEVDGEGYGNLHFEDGSYVLAWNPLQFSGDALELAVKLRFGVNVTGGLNWTSITFFGNPGHYFNEISAPYVQENHGADPLAATRRAIVRAAAEIGKQHA